MRIQFARSAVVVAGVLAALLLTRAHAVPTGRFDRPETVIHVVSIQWKPGVSEGDKQKVLQGVQQMAARIPGIKRVWIQSVRVEPREFDDGFAIEFQSRAAADAYADNPIHKAWNDFYDPLRAASVSIDVTNP